MYHSSRTIWLSITVPDLSRTTSTPSSSPQRKNSEGCAHKCRVCGVKVEFNHVDKNQLGLWHYSRMNQLLLDLRLNIYHEIRLDQPFRWKPHISDFRKECLPTMNTIQDLAFSYSQICMMDTNNLKILAFTLIPRKNFHHRTHYVKEFVLLNDLI